MSKYDSTDVLVSSTGCIDINILASDAIEAETNLPT